MYHLRIISIGKTKEPWLEEACAEYVKRLTKKMSIECIWLKNDQQLIAALQKEPLVFCLDPKGKPLDSPHFAQHLERCFLKGGSHVAIAIGGPEGLPEEVRSFYPLVSFSNLTMTHQIVRIVLFEQLYRAIQILEGTPYHK